MDNERSVQVALDGVQIALEKAAEQATRLAMTQVEYERRKLGDSMREYLETMRDEATRLLNHLDQLPDTYHGHVDSGNVLDYEDVALWAIGKATNLTALATMTASQRTYYMEALARLQALTQAEDLIKGETE